MIVALRNHLRLPAPVKPKADKAKGGKGTPKKKGGKSGSRKRK